MWSTVLTGICLLGAIAPQVYSKFQLYDQWSFVDFDYNSQQKQDDLKNNRLRPKDVVIYSAELHTAGAEETLFVTTPNLFNATRFSLSIVNDSKLASDNSSMLVPYPDETWYKGDCNNSIISVFRVKVDKFHRLWVVDSGMVNQMTPESSLICPPKILIFDLKTNTLIKKYKIPDNQHYDDSLLINIELDYRNDDGSDVMAYISDVTGYRMLVYNFKNDSSYPIDNPYFNPFPVYAFFRNINGVNFTLLNGLYSISIANGTDPDRPVYFHSLSSAREGGVKLSVLSDPTLSHDAFNYEISSVRGFHSSVQVMTPEGFLIFTNIERNSIMIWDSVVDPYEQRYFRTIVRDNQRMQFITGMQLIDGRKLLITSSRYQNVLTGNIAKDQINYRVLIDLNISKFLKRKN